MPSSIQITVAGDFSASHLQSKRTNNMEAHHWNGGLKQKELGNGPWFRDSLEFCREEKMAELSSSPQETLLVGGEEEEEIMEPQFSMTGLSLGMNCFVLEEEEDLPTGNKEENGPECELDLNFDDSDSDSEIIFEDVADEYIPKVTSTPFWFGGEDKEQLRHVIQQYHSFLKLAEEKKKMVRQPEPFVGKISRSKVDNGDTFTTLDVVEIYSRSILPPGSVMPILRKSYVLTCWSAEDGLPTKFLLLQSQGSIRNWKEKIIVTQEASILLCLPVYGTKDYSFSVSSEPTEVTHAPSSLTMDELRGYEQYIPKQAQKSQRNN